MHAFAAGHEIPNSCANAGPVWALEGSGTATRRTLFRTYQRLARDGKLTLRIDLRWPLADWKELAQLGTEAGFGDEAAVICAQHVEEAPSSPSENPDGKWSHAAVTGTFSDARAIARSRGT